MNNKLYLNKLYYVLKPELIVIGILFGLFLGACVQAAYYDGAGSNKNNGNIRIQASTQNAGIQRYSSKTPTGVQQYYSGKPVVRQNQAVMQTHSASGPAVVKSYVSQQPTGVQRYGTSNVRQKTYTVTKPVVTQTRVSQPPAKAYNYATTAVPHTRVYKSRQSYQGSGDRTLNLVNNHTYQTSGRVVATQNAYSNSLPVRQYINPQTEYQISGRPKKVYAGGGYTVSRPVSSQRQAYNNNYSNYGGYYISRSAVPTRYYTGVRRVIRTRRVMRMGHSFEFHSVRPMRIIRVIGR